MATGCTREIVNGPPLPAEFRHLPAKATTIGCLGELRPPGIVHAYELPGLTPNDNSAGNGDRGRDLFVLPYCEEVQVVAYAWSEMDQTYYLRVQLKDGREGWTWESFVNIR